MQKTRFKTDIKYRRSCIESLAKKHGWELVFEDNEMYIFLHSRMSGAVGGTVKMKIWVKRMNVLTELTHPKQGLTTLERKGVSGPIIKGLFRNPRLHTDVKTKHLNKKPNEKNNVVNRLGPHSWSLPTVTTQSQGNDRKGKTNQPRSGLATTIGRFYKRSAAFQ